VLIVLLTQCRCASTPAAYSFLVTVLESDRLVSCIAFDVLSTFLTTRLVVCVSALTRCTCSSCVLSVSPSAGLERAPWSALAASLVRQSDGCLCECPFIHRCVQLMQFFDIVSRVFLKVSVLLMRLFSSPLTVMCPPFSASAVCCLHLSACMVTDYALCMHEYLNDTLSDLCG